MGGEVNLQKQIDDAATCIDKYMQSIAEEIDRDGNNLIELAQQEQSLQQLTDLVRMEKSMDVLEFIFLAAVLLDIFGFLFAALGEIWGREGAAGMGLHYILTHLWAYPALLTALFVPVIMILSYYIIKLAERLIK